MPDDQAVGLEDLTEQEIEAVVRTRMFQKSLAYRRLSEGIEVLEDEDALYDSMVTSITDRHSSNLSRGSVDQVLELFVEEVQMFTDPLVDEQEGDVDFDELFVEE